MLRYLPVMRHTYCSDVRISVLPGVVEGIGSAGDVKVAIKDEDGGLLPSAIPDVSIIKDCSYSESGLDDAEEAVDILALLKHKLLASPLSGFVLEGASPYGRSVSMSRARALSVATFSGLPVVQTGRGNTTGFAEGSSTIIAGSNLTSTKARLLLMLCIMKFGMLPKAQDPTRPTREEVKTIERRVSLYQDIFDRH